jgi:hypothetical protein
LGGRLRPRSSRCVRRRSVMRFVPIDGTVTLRGEHHRLAIAVMCDGQHDVAQTDIEIGNLVARIWQALGETVEC